MPVEKRKKIARVIMFIGLIFLILGIMPGFLTFQLGTVLFVFSLVAGGLVMVAVPDPDPQINDHSEEGENNQL